MAETSAPQAQQQRALKDEYFRNFKREHVDGCNNPICLQCVLFRLLSPARHLMQSEHAGAENFHVVPIDADVLASVRAVLVLACLALYLYAHQGTKHVFLPAVIAQLTALQVWAV